MPCGVGEGPVFVAPPVLEKGRNGGGLRPHYIILILTRMRDKQIILLLIHNNLR